VSSALPSLEHPGLLPAVLLGEPSAGGRPAPRSARDWVVDVIAFLLCLMAGGLLLVGQAETNGASGRMVVADVALGIVACVSLWWRRRWPVQVGLLTAVISAVSYTSGFAAVAGLFTVALHRRFQRVVVVAAVNLLAGYVLSMLRPDPGTPFWVSAVVGVLFVLVAVAWGMLARARRQIVLSLRDRAERAEAEQLLRVSQARQLERTRIAREMHDVLAHRISLISLHAGALEFSAGATPQDAADSAAVIRRSAHEALEDLRQILGVLRADPDGDETLAPPAVERPQPTLADLAGLVQQSRAAGMHLTLRDRVQDSDRVPASVGRTAFRVVQEGLTNARKHAPHAAVTVQLSGAPGSGLDVEIRNRGSVLTGPGAAASLNSGRRGTLAAPGANGTSRGNGTSRAAGQELIPGAGQGLVGLVERTMLIGGRLEHGRTSDGDFRLHAWLPWAA